MISRTRTRTLTFRVTDDEFERLQVASNVTGARCLSDFIRQSALNTIARGADQHRWASSHAEAVHPTVADQLHGVEERLNSLESRLSDLLIGDAVDDRRVT